MGLFYPFHIILFSFILRILYVFANQDVKLDEYDNDLLYCHFCGLLIGDTSDIAYIPSEGAKHVENRNISGKSVTVQTLKNPSNYFFDVITTYKASCFDDGLNMRADSWFPDYSWRVCKCPHCKHHLGWKFERAISNNLEETNFKKSFYALILQSLYKVGGVSTVIKMRSEIWKDPMTTNETLPLFLDTPIDIKKPTAPTVTGNVTTAKSEEVIKSSRTAGGTIVILKNRARNLSGNGTHTDNGTHTSTAPK